MKNQRNRARRRVGLILALLGLISAATLVLGPARLASAQVVAPSWSYTGSLLDQGGDARTMVNGFVNAAEYRQRFGTP